LFAGIINILANTTKVPTDLVVGNPQNSQTITFQKSGTFRIFVHVYFFIVL